MQCVLAASGRVLLTAATDMSVRRWQADDLTVPARVLVELATPVTALAADADASVVLVGGAQGELILGRPSSWQTLLVDGPVITSCALASDARTALVGDESGNVGLWQLTVVRWIKIDAG
jgi:hypothetical protein